MAKDPAPRGRPVLASRAMLQEAAFELFLEQGYEHTTVEQIATRAGVGRSTFFNHFTGKADVFWIELDDAAAILEGELARQLAGAGLRSPIDGLDCVHRAIAAVGSTWGPQSVPFVLTQLPLIGSVNDLQASAVSRLTTHTSLISGFLEQTGHSAARARVIAYAVIAASVAAATNWASAGSTRGDLVDHVDAAVSPILAGFAT